MTVGSVLDIAVSRDYGKENDVKFGTLWES